MLADICDQCDGRLIVGSESVRVPASEYCRCEAEGEDTEIELMGTGASALDPALSARLFLAVGELDVVAVVSCDRHFEGRDWTIDIKRVSCGDEDVSAPDGLRDQIEDWLERERRGAAKSVWELV